MDSMQAVFDLTPCSKAHPEPNKEDEIEALLGVYKMERVNVFCPGRSLRHLSKNMYSNGTIILDPTKLSRYLDDNAHYIKVVHDTHSVPLSSNMNNTLSSSGSESDGGDDKSGSSSDDSTNE
jgi:hypothetical protein